MTSHDFKISINETLYAKWGFQYPFTCMFNLPESASSVEVFKRNSISESWKQLPEKTSDDFFNGIECVRFDYMKNKAYVSVGFGTTNNIHLRLTNVQRVTYDSIANYYDNRKPTYTLSNDNWGREPSANPGAPWQGMMNDNSDKYQAMVHACRLFNLPVSIAINSQCAGGASLWDRMQDELNYGDNSWEPAVHTRTHPSSTSEYSAKGYEREIIGCKEDILGNLTKIPYGDRIFEFILPGGFHDGTLEKTSAGEFILLRAWDSNDHPSSLDYAPWNTTHQYYGIGAIQTKAYDNVLQSVSPAGKYNESAVNELNSEVDRVYNSGGIFYAMFHSDRYRNSIIYNTSPKSSTLMEHFAYIANKKEVWYVANGWMYLYRMAAERAKVETM